MKAEITLSEKFLPGHLCEGKETFFEEKIKDGRKIHTCRKNYKKWSKEIEMLKYYKGDLEIYMLKNEMNIGRYELIKTIPSEQIGIQRLILSRQINQIAVPVKGLNVTYSAFLGYAYTAIVSNCYVPIEILAKNDGLSVLEYILWFLPEFEKRHTDVLELALIHFTEKSYPDIILENMEE